MSVFGRLLSLLLAFVPLSICAAVNHLPVVGEDYVEIPDGRPFAPLAGKIEVVEIFGYTCPHCAHFDFKLQAWGARQAKDVRFTLVPAVFGGVWDPFARAYLAADVLGVAKRSHAAMFEAIHEKGSVPIQNVGPDELAVFYAGYGVQPDRFVATFNGPEVEKRFQAARAYALKVRPVGTPTIVVDGRYMVTGHDFDDTLRITDYLVSRERAASHGR
ncbi:thiol:disulfide interchange protein DsbA/DsbL [Xylella fastidiosa subsp. multiplex]|uniref:Thiol:disulfide interchange protein n=1 Tax=Xylella fastidiosa subsp. multiplex TaxID=644357 RepID=A0AAW6HWY8_XYLFS|nr:thiol:disulfide interchange protein DsbA/DsbL [Xylella fastidiosa]MCH7233425.1 thiol:disulfide interchange protein DsbA/DsbL [Xylella fastidiosa subsp. multiplex]MDC6408972.1 thiol:disulfide interchange protein DsbA/DsbL [Xylella fastidiosa subsp. multiplex]MDD0935802.1 thiol:disulfide interchange protein DsbA/DsbL [Xylella fastidiosa subsp. multiplex]MSS69139.1 thiol:disulfide interchange protein DsbA/DsbL [Xylella fastidiosa subsp. multiplex]